MWWSDHVETFVRFRIRKIEGSLEGSDKNIHQHFTVSSCEVGKMYCIPEEQKKGVIVWSKMKHNFKIFRSLGDFDIDQFGNFYLISKLAIAGTKIREDNGMILLENSYVLKKINGTKMVKGQEKKFMKASKRYATKTKANVQRELLEGQLAQELIREENMIKTMAATLCRTQKEIRRLEAKRNEE